MAPLSAKRRTSIGSSQLEALEQLRRDCLEQCIESACAVLKAADVFVAEKTVVEKRVPYSPLVRSIDLPLI